MWRTTWLWKRKKIKIISKRKNKWKNKKTEKGSGNNNDKLLGQLLEGENFFFCKLLTNLEYEKHDTLNDIAALESKLIRYLNELIELQIRFYYLSLCYYESKSSLKNSILIIKTK